MVDIGRRVFKNKSPRKLLLLSFVYDNADRRNFKLIQQTHQLIVFSNYFLLYINFAMFSEI